MKKLTLFNISNVDIIIFVYDQQGRSPYDPKIKTARISDGFLKYFTMAKDDKFNYKNEFSETYAEAQQLKQNLSSKFK
jgi:hypothetical protein